MTPNLLVYEIKFGEEIRPLFFLINQTTATALPLIKTEDFRREDHLLQFQLEPKGPLYGFSLYEESTYVEHFAHLLLAEITRQVGFSVTHFVHNHPQARNVFGHLIDEFMEEHKLPIG